MTAGSTAVLILIPVPELSVMVIVVDREVVAIGEHGIAPWLRVSQLTSDRFTDEPA
jgi:hypothetical protein